MFRFNMAVMNVQTQEWMYEAHVSSGALGCGAASRCRDKVLDSFDSIVHSIAQSQRLQEGLTPRMPEPVAAADSTPSACFTVFRAILCRLAGRMRRRYASHCKSQRRRQVQELQGRLPSGDVGFFTECSPTWPQAVMLSSLCALSPKAVLGLLHLPSNFCKALQDWSPDHEVAWNWLWETVERLLSKVRSSPSAFASLKRPVPYCARGAQEAPRSRAHPGQIPRTQRARVAHSIDFVHGFCMISAT